MNEFQLEENLKMSQQAQDHSPYDPNAAVLFPDGYTPVGDVSINTPVEDAPSINVGEVEVTASIDFSNSALESYGSSGDNVVLRNITPAEAFKAYGIDITPVKKNDISFNLDTISFGSGNIVDGSIVVDDLPEPEPPVDPPVDPPADPDPEDPEDPDPEDPEDPDPEDPGKGNPGNDKEVGNSPWDGETGASDNPGKGNHQDGQDPETNQPPGDSKNNGGQNNAPKNDSGDGGSGGNNGFGNGDQDAPGNSGPNNNAENSETSIGDYVDRFVSEHPGDHWYEDIILFDDNSYYDDPQISPPVIDFNTSELPHFDNFDHPMDHFDHSM
jgi:hypothetical protein